MFIVMTPKIITKTLNLLNSIDRNKAEKNMMHFSDTYVK